MWAHLHIDILSLTLSQIFKAKGPGGASRELKGFPTDVVLENARSVLLDFQGKEPENDQYRTLLFKL